MDVLLSRRSVRTYTADDIPQEKLEEILQAGLLAPSSRAIFPVEFIVVKDAATLRQLARAKTSGSSMLSKARCAVVVIGDTERSDAWIEDCSLAMFAMQLAATDLGIGSCWVQCRGRTSQQKKGEPLSADAEDAERPAAATVAADKARTDNLSTGDFVRGLLGIPSRYAVEAILSLGTGDRTVEPRALPDAACGKVHEGRF